MPRKQKDIGVVIEFDAKEYSYEEASFLWARFFSVVARIEKNPGRVYTESIFTRFCKELGSKMDSNSKNS